MFLLFLYSHLTEKRTIIANIIRILNRECKRFFGMRVSQAGRKIREKNIPLKGRKEIYPVLPNKAFDCTLRADLG